MRPPQNAGENLPTSSYRLVSYYCFNEAPAKRGGKRGEGAREQPRGPVASMRPPQNAGENGRGAGGDHPVGLASMRPPQNAGENPDPGHPAHAGYVASMRPPQNAGENHAVPFRLLRHRLRFNEAPAKRGGKRRARRRSYYAASRQPLRAVRCPSSCKTA